MLTYQRILGTIWLALGIAVCYMSYHLDLGSAGSPGSGFFPFLTGCLLILLSLIYLSNSFFFSRISEENGSFWTGILWKNQLFVAAILIVYVLLLPVFGYLIMTFLFIFSLMRIFEPLDWKMAFIVSAATVVATYLIFDYWLMCQFPMGIFYGSLSEPHTRV